MNNASIRLIVKVLLPLAAVTALAACSNTISGSKATSTPVSSSSLNPSLINLAEFKGTYSARNYRNLTADIRLNASLLESITSKSRLRFKIVGPNIRYVSEYLSPSDFKSTLYPLGFWYTGHVAKNCVKGDPRSKVSIYLESKDGTAAFLHFVDQRNCPIATAVIMTQPRF